MADIPYLAHIDSKGEIVCMELSQGALPQNHSKDHEGHEVIYITDLEGLEAHEFMEQRRYEARLQNFEIRPAPPRHALGVFSWDIDSRKWRPNSAIVFNALRDERNRRLAETDWAVLTDSPLAGKKRTQILKYRQALREFPLTVDFSVLENNQPIEWPVVPYGLGISPRDERTPFPSTTSRSQSADEPLPYEDIDITIDPPNGG